jgi:hypothetical protein
MTCDIPFGESSRLRVNRVGLTTSPMHLDYPQFRKYFGVAANQRNVPTTDILSVGATLQCSQLEASSGCQTHGD